MPPPFLDNINHFRSHPPSIIPHLQQRIPRYRKINDQMLLLSHTHRKKAIKIANQTSPEQRINELIKTIQSLDSLPSLNHHQKMDEVAMKIWERIHEQECLSVIEFDGQLLRGMLKEDADFEYPTPLYCLVSMCFDLDMEELVSLLVDDDVPDHQNRMILLQLQIAYMGFHSGIVKNKEHLRLTVMLLTEQVRPKYKQLPFMSAISEIKGLGPTKSESRIQFYENSMNASQSAEPQKPKGSLQEHQNKPQLQKIEDGDGSAHLADDVRVSQYISE